MLLPRFTIRQLLLCMVGVAFVCMVLGFAARGNVVAWGMGLAMLGLFIPIGVYAAVYWFTLGVSKILPGPTTPMILDANPSIPHQIPDRDPASTSLSDGENPTESY